MGQLNEPLWVRVIVLGCVLSLAAFGGVGLLLADLGLFTPVLWLGFGLVVLGGLVHFARPLARAEGRVSEASNVGAIGAVLISLTSIVWNGLNAAKHVQINRDGAVFMNAGKWIATHGTLEVNPYVAPFTKGLPFIGSSTGMRPRGSHLEFDVSHMLSALLAEAHSIGGDRAMFLTVPVLGGISLLVFYLLAARLLRHPFAALAATATLAFAMPQVSFSRDSTSEIPTQILLFTALWLICDHRVLRSRRTGFCVGLLFGLVPAMYGDGLVLLLGLPMVCAALWMRAKHVDRAGLRTGIVGCSLGVVAGVALAALDMFLWNRAYLSILRNDLIGFAIAGVLITAASTLAVRAHRRRPDLVDSVRRRRETAANVTFALVLLFGFGAWLVRPLVQTTHSSANPTVALVQRLNGIDIDATRRYAELSVRWIGWYIGPITLFLGIVGAAVLARLLVQGTLRAPPATTALILAPPVLLLIWRPNVTPDQVWAARRFLPAVFPALILAAFGLLCAAARDRSRPLLSERRFVVVALAVLAAAFPLYTIRDVHQMTEQRGLFPVIADACRKIGPRGAVVLLQESQRPKSTAFLSNPQTLRSYCDVPVVVLLGTPNAPTLQRLAAQWRVERRRLLLVAEHPQTILRVFPNAVVRPTLVGQELHLLEATLLRRPSRYTSDQFHVTAVSQLMIAAVPGAPPARARAG